MISTFDIPIGAFQPGSSHLHRIDPRAKISVFAAMLIGIVLTNTWNGLLLTAIISVAAALSTEKAARIGRDVSGFRFFYFFTIFMHLIFDRGGNTLFQFGKFEVTTFGIIAGIFFSLKIALIAMLGGLFSRTTHPADLSKSLGIMLPSRGPIARLLGRPGIVVGLALRMLPTILAEAERIRTAQLARGLKLTEGGLIKRTKNLLPLIGPLLTATLKRGDAIHAAMSARGFVLDRDRTTFLELRMKFSDWSILAGGIVVSIIAVVL